MRDFAFDIAPESLPAVAYLIPALTIESTIATPPTAPKTLTPIVIYEYAFPASLLSAVRISEFPILACWPVLVDWFLTLLASVAIHVNFSVSLDLEEQVLYICSA